MPTRGSSTGTYTEQVRESVLDRWSAADRGWRATLLGGLLVGAVLVGLPIPW